MEALIASYGDSSSDSDSESPAPRPELKNSEESSSALPPPPLSLLNSPNSFVFDVLTVKDFWTSRQALSQQNEELSSRGRELRSTCLHPSLYSTSTKERDGLIFEQASFSGARSHAVDVDIPLEILRKDEHKLEQVALGREFHISLGRTVPIRVHQIDSLVTMLRQKLQIQRRYWIDFSKWEVFVNDDHTRSFVSIEVIAAGLAEITKQIQAVNEVYKLHNLPEFYKDPRPHISVAWASDDISSSLKQAVEEEREDLLSEDHYRNVFLPVNSMASNVGLVAKPIKYVNFLNNSVTVNYTIHFCCI
ncbi:U6 snRNA phosphodiesterase [Prunus yedoensis var. nudiflora]|uniref:U6 snRNA phosphodiesterase 1 n=1 Tax=Prunus yedoensis var. nudiflora TaxID=2094558 RepID=A0A314UPP2_PRUYE|nr:U6 snRNA phosphodiesterase [Prunus yedoensis var. nudiflora]